MQAQESSYALDPRRGRPSRDHHYEEDHDNLQELKQENSKLKKLLKETQAKRTQITKECSQLSRTIEQLESENQQLRGRVREENEKCDGEKYRWEELKFLNKQLSSEIESLRGENENLSAKLRYSSEVLERKYEEMEEKTFKRMEQSVKRVKKTIHYLQNLTIRELEKTRDILIDNLRKSIELLRGKAYEEFTCEGEIEELMNPLKTMQEEIMVKTKEANHLRQENARLTEEMTKYKGLEKEQIPMFKEAIERLKKSLAQVRGQLSENEYEKMQIKKKYEEKLKESEYKYNELFKENRKIKLEKKIYENKLEELEADVEEEKERLQGENMMLKKLYGNQQDSSSSRISQISATKPTFGWKDKKTEEKKLKKNYSSNELKTSHAHMKASVSEYDMIGKGGTVEVSDYNEESSMLSQENLKQQICRIDEEIMEIQKNLTKQLEAYR